MRSGARNRDRISEWLELGRWKRIKIRKYRCFCLKKRCYLLKVERMADMLSEIILVIFDFKTPVGYPERHESLLNNSEAQRHGCHYYYYYYNLSVWAFDLALKAPVPTPIFHSEIPRFNMHIWPLIAVSWQADPGGCGGTSSNWILSTHPRCLVFIPVFCPLSLCSTTIVGIEEWTCGRGNLSLINFISL